MSGSNRLKSDRTAKNQNASVPLHNGEKKMAEASVSPLTLELLVSELEKSRKMITEDFNATLLSALAPINSSLGSVTQTVASHTATIAEMETALSSHSDDITSFQKDVATLTTKLATVTEENESLQNAVEDLISRSKRQNLRLVGLPDNIERGDPRQFMQKCLRI